MRDPSILLNGLWDIGDNRAYSGQAAVPGIPRDPGEPQQGTLWLRREVTLPEKPFTRVFMTLQGARFCPTVYVNGVLCAKGNGGMAPVRLELVHPDCIPGQRITLEICLCSLLDMPADDASCIPGADQWRSNISSCLWDDVSLDFAGDASIDRVIPAMNCELLRADVSVNSTDRNGCQLCMLLKKNGRVIQKTPWEMHREEQVRLEMPLNGIEQWDIHRGEVYNLEIIARSGNVEASAEVNVAAREFALRDKRLYLNGHPITLRGTSVVWHRFCRDPEGRMLAFDRAWFKTAILDRLDSMGANFLRFHLGSPPEWIMDELDRRGICMQIEWSFFHGMHASEESLTEQWRAFFALIARHPCVCVAQLWNETTGDDLQRAHRVIEKLRAELPLPLLDDIDLLPLHKYWWSLFENLSLSYRSADELPLPAIADEFGGNYMDGEAVPGLYPEAADSFVRFLGADSTAEERLEHQALASGRIAEYWRILGVAGYANFCALGSRQDGNHLFLGPLRDNRPKPAWQACSAAYADCAACIELWDRAFVQGETVTAPLHFFRDCAGTAPLTARVEVLDEAGNIVSCDAYTMQPEPYGRADRLVSVVLPTYGERCTIRARMGAAVSAWPVRLYQRVEKPSLRGKRVWVLGGDGELTAFARSVGMRLAEPGEPCDLIAGGSGAVRLLRENPDMNARVEAAVSAGAGLLLTQVGPRALGEGYLEGRSVRADGLTATDEQNWTESLPFGLTVNYHSLPEPESCCHRAPASEPYWKGLHRQALQVSNGYRGGLNAPAAGMTVEGLGREAYLRQWTSRGASPELFEHENAVAYSLCGFYAFAEEPNDAVCGRLRDHVRLLIEDAPSLQDSADPEAPIGVEEIAAVYRALPQRRSELHPIAVCGRTLERAAAFVLRLENVRGPIIISQLLTEGRLHADYAQPGMDGPHTDPEMVRLVLNMMDELIKESGT